MNLTVRVKYLMTRLLHLQHEKMSLTFKPGTDHVHVAQGRGKRDSAGRELILQSNIVL